MRFEDKVYGLVSQIPEGKITTYGELARALGDIRAARAVGKILHDNPRPIEVPCHRVIMSNGTLGGYVSGRSAKVRLLKKEGIEFSNYDKVKDLQKLLFVNFKTNYPLKQLRFSQEVLKNQIITEDGFESIEIIGGVDVAYSNHKSIGAYVGFDYKSKNVIEEKIVEGKVEFPYISTYLAFREAPIIKKIIESLNTLPTILMIDGNGILHPYRMGIASHVGVKLDIPTIGVAKSLLCGKLDHAPKKLGETAKIMYEDKLVGYGLKSSNSSKLIYISPGHKISVETALRVVKKFCIFRVPEPIRRAHLVATEEMRKVCLLI